MPDDARERLAADQARLVAALSGQAATPAGFDTARIDLAAQTLVAKRRKTIAKGLPRLVESLGDTFVERLGVFASQFPPNPDGPFRDGIAFAHWLERRGEMPLAAVREYVAARLWSGPPLGAVMRRDADGVCIGFRVPWLGARIVSLPFFAQRGGGGTG